MRHWKVDQPPEPSAEEIELRNRVLRLRQKGWSVAGICKYLELPETDVRRICGVMLASDMLHVPAGRPERGKSGSGSIRQPENTKARQRAN